MRSFKGLIFLVILLVGRLAAQGLPEGIFLGARAPEFKGVDQFGRTIQLREEAKKNPYIIIFYRGSWCPHCMRLLSRLQDSLPFFTEKGVGIVAISPESDSSLKKTLQKTNAGFSLIRDTGLFIANKYDVAYALSESQRARYRSGGIDLDKLNYPNPPQLVVPSVFIVGKDYTVNFRFFDPDHKKRINVIDILSQL